MAQTHLLLGLTIAILVIMISVHCQRAKDRKKFKRLKETELFTSMYSKRMEFFSLFARENETFPIKQILDVGANQCDWAFFIQPYFPNADIFLIEANPWLEENINQTGYPYEIALVGDKLGKSVNFQYNDRYKTGGSMVSSNHAT